MIGCFSSGEECGGSPSFPSEGHGEEKTWPPTVTSYWILMSECLALFLLTWSEVLDCGPGLVLGESVHSVCVRVYLGVCGLICVLCLTRQCSQQTPQKKSLDLMILSSVSRVNSESTRLLVLCDNYPPVMSLGGSAALWVM